MSSYKQRVLITGADGVVASRLVEFLQLNYEVFAFNRHQLDITNEQQTITTIGMIRPHYVIHCAAIADTRACEENPELSYAVNVEGSINVAKGCAKVHAKLLFFSSDQVYSDNELVGPYDENTSLTPKSIYAKHKLQAENALLELLDDTVVIRITWLFTLLERNKKTNANIVWNVISAAMTNNQMTLATNEYRGMTYVHDLVENIERILQLPRGVYNIGSENNTNTYEIAKHVLITLGLAHRINDLLVADEERFKIKPRDLRIDTAKMKVANIVFPTTEEAITKCLHEYSFQVM